MVSDGTYNGTVWPSVLAGIEHQRSHSLDALKDESVTLKLSAYGDIAKTTAALYGQMITGSAMPTPVSAMLPTPGIWPMYMRSTTL